MNASPRLSPRYKENEKLPEHVKEKLHCLSTILGLLANPAVHRLHQPHWALPVAGQQPGPTRKKAFVSSDVLVNVFFSFFFYMYRRGKDYEKDIFLNNNVPFCTVYVLAFVGIFLCLSLFLCGFLTVSKLLHMKNQMYDCWGNKQAGWRIAELYFTLSFLNT